MGDVVTADGALLIDRALARAIAALLERDAETADYARELRALPGAQQVPEGWRAALVKAEAALADIGDADREPGDDVAWCERRAAEALPALRAILASSPPAPEQPACTQRGECDCIGQCKNGRGGSGAEQPKPAGDVEALAEWLEREMPAGTVIGDPRWWAGRIVRRLSAKPAGDVEGVLSEVAAERARQDEQWGGPEHDDEHVPFEWNGFIGLQLDAADRATVKRDRAQWRERMIKIAALAVAAIESHDRLSAQPARGEGEN